MCTVCKEVDGVEHHLFYYIESKQFWSDLKLWMKAKLNFGFKFSVCKKLFGFANHSIPDAEIIICLILMGNRYLNNSKTKETSILFFEFLSILRKQLELIVGVAVFMGHDEYTV